MYTFLYLNKNMKLQKGMKFVEVYFIEMAFYSGTPSTQNLWGHPNILVSYPDFVLSITYHTQTKFKRESGLFLTTM